MPGYRVHTTYRFVLMEVFEPPTEGFITILLREWEGWMVNVNHYNITCGHVRSYPSIIIITNHSSFPGTIIELAKKWLDY